MTLFPKAKQISVLLTLICFNFPNSLVGQKTEIQAKVFFKRSMNPVQFANVYLKNSGVGTFTNEFGYFNITVDVGDTLIISSVQSNPSYFLYPFDLDSIFLEERIASLDEVVVISEKIKYGTYRIGFFNNKSSGSYAGANSVLLYLNPLDVNNDATIKSALIRLNKVKWIYDKRDRVFYQLLVRLKLHNPNSELRPGTSILNQDVVQLVSEKQEKIYFDLNELNIKFPDNGIFIGLEFIGYYKEDEFIPFRTNDKKKVIQYKASFSNKHEKPNSWVKHDHEDSWRLLDFGTNKYYNFNFGIELLKPKK